MEFTGMGGGENVGAGQGYTNIDVLPLGKLLQTKFLSGKSAKGKKKETNISKLMERGFK